MSTPEVHHLKLAEILQSKAPKLAKKLPRFVIWLLERLIHQNHMNEYIDYVQGATGVDYFKKIMEFSKIKVEVSGLEHLEAGKPYIFASNHPLGGLDGIALISILGDKFPNIRAFVNDILMHMHYAKPVFLPINKHGANSKQYALMGQEAYNQGHPILMFPAGLVSRKQNGIVCDPVWRKNFIKKAIENKRQIVPIYFEGKNSRLFYFVSKLRKKIGIKFNIEMALLANEVCLKEGKSFRITIGEPINYQKFDKSIKPLDEWAQSLQKETYQMGGVDISKLELSKLI